MSPGGQEDVTWRDGDRDCRGARAMLRRPSMSIALGLSRPAVWHKGHCAVVLARPRSQVAALNDGMFTLDLETTPLAALDADVIGAPIDPCLLMHTRSSRNASNSRLPTFKTPIAPGQIYTAHMFTCRWVNGLGWGAPEIKPLQDITLSPAATVFHYGMTCFENIAVVLGIHDTPRILRPYAHLKRLRESAKVSPRRLCCVTMCPMWIITRLID